jgi:hypothetical protein
MLAVMVTLVVTLETVALLDELTSVDALVAAVIN